MSESKEFSPRVVDLVELVSAPLLASVEADFRATQKCLALIADLCFVPLNGNPTSASGESLGKLRTLSLLYYQPGSDGQMQTLMLQIPVLSLITLPLIQIDEVEFDMAIYLLYAVEESTVKTEGAGERIGFPKAGKLWRWRAGLVPTAVGTGHGRGTRLRVKARSASLPAGMAQLLNLSGLQLQSVAAPMLEPKQDHTAPLPSPPRKRRRSKPSYKPR